MLKTLRPGPISTLLLCVLAAPVVAEPADYATLVRETPGVLLHYRFEEETTTVSDVSGRRRDGQIDSKSMRRQPTGYASLGYGIHLASGSRVRIPDLGQHEAVTVELWFNASNHSEEIAALYAVDVWQPQALHLNIRAGGSIEFALNGMAAFPVSEPGTVSLAKWTHLVATYERGTGEIALYRNGRRVLHAKAEPRMPVRLSAATLGAWVTDKPTRPLTAMVAEFAIYSQALTPERIRRHYLAGKGVDETPVDFAQQIRPLLAKHCMRCHGPKTQKAGLRLDIRDSAARGGESGEPGFEPFDADASHLIQRVTSTDESMVMPPDGARLSAEQVRLLRTWIEQGAAWPDELAGRLEAAAVVTQHWSLQPLRALPSPSERSAFIQGGNPIDAFVLQKLREQGLTPSPPAERRTLIRRLYLDVHGIPPTPEEIDQFERDTAPDAWRRLVERVLASPRYGERLASHWLDVIRYGDTHGFEVNTPRVHAWPYRDYVIRSFNEDKPYDQFVREQIAGDQLGADVATGFLVAAPVLLPGQVGKDEPSMRQARADELHEILVTVGTGVLGLTIGCARCHNHKFDPVSQQDYYKLQAVFAGVYYGNRSIRDEVSNIAYAGTFAQPAATRRLYRGDPMQPRERVPPDIPAVFGSLSLESSAPEAQRRLAVAAWLTDPQNPLTARVIVNRIWQHRFGTGLVATPSDFGAMGKPPTHPELLDWLATRLIADGWSLKRLTRMILLSNTYQQASTPTPQGLATDANTAYLWRFPPRRLDMEPIRDSMLAVAGTLDQRMGGPGFLVFKPNDNYVRVYDPKEEWGPSDWRRMIYMHRVRMAQDGVFGAFDCPDAGQPAPLRSRSTTALQALNLLNSTFVLQQAEEMARRVHGLAGEEVVAQVNSAFRSALGRLPTPDQQEAAVQLVRNHGLPALCRALFNTNEFLFLP